jgi:hypothetical protein
MPERQQRRVLRPSTIKPLAFSLEGRWTGQLLPCLVVAEFPVSGD